MNTSTPTPLIQLWRACHLYLAACRTRSIEFMDVQSKAAARAYVDYLEFLGDETMSRSMDQRIMAKVWEKRWAK